MMLVLNFFEFTNLPLQLYLSEINKGELFLYNKATKGIRKNKVFFRFLTPLFKLEVPLVALFIVGYSPY